MTPDEIQRLVDQDGIPRCAKCGQPVRFNVPRLGWMAGFVHEETCSILCQDELEIARQEERDWTHVLNWAAPILPEKPTL